MSTKRAVSRSASKRYSSLFQEPARTSTDDRGTTETMPGSEIVVERDPYRDGCDPPREFFFSEGHTDPWYYAGSIINGFCSKNPQELEKAKCKADILLSDDKVFDEMSLKVKLDKTVINKKPSSETPGGPEMSPEAFMAYTEKDAKERTEARRENKRIADGFTKKANTAFREGEYDKALELYTKAIEAKRDSWLLYSNRALTFLRLGLYNRTIEDCDNVIKLNEKNMKGWLLQARAYHLRGDFDEADRCIKEAKIRNPDSLAHIEAPSPIASLFLSAPARNDLRSKIAFQNYVMLLELR